jgi:hypothetical protein
MGLAILTVISRDRLGEYERCVERCVKRHSAEELAHTNNFM